MKCPHRQSLTDNREQTEQSHLSTKWDTIDSLRSAQESHGAAHLSGEPPRLVPDLLGHKENVIGPTTNFARLLFIAAITMLLARIDAGFIEEQIAEFVFLPGVKIQVI